MTRRPLRACRRSSCQPGRTAEPLTAVASVPVPTLPGVERFVRTPGRTLAALRKIGALLDADLCWHLGDSYHFVLDEGWSLALSADSAERWRVQACRFTVPAVERWVLAGNDERLAALVVDMAGEIRAAVAAHNSGGEDHAAVHGAGSAPPGAD